MKMRFDWKFWIGLTVSLLSVLVSIWLWRADLSAHSIHFKKISQTSLQPPDVAKTLDLQISIAGVELPTPYLTVFELLNDGTKPVSSSDFESPIEIVPTNKATIVRTSISNVNPKDLAPIISVEANAIKIKPMLFNPGDAITIAVLTTGGEPAFVSRARIAGVKAVPIVDVQFESKAPKRLGFLLAAVSLTCLVASSLVLDGWPTKGTVLRPRAAFLIFMVTNFAAVLSMIFSLEELGMDGFWTVIVAVFVGMIIAGFISGLLNRTEALSTLNKN